jgi:hypothetical protein
VLGHVVLATVGAGLLVRTLFGLLPPVDALRQFSGLLLAPFFPVQIVAGIVIGYLYSHLFPERAALLAWIPAGLWFLLRWATLQTASDSLLSITDFDSKWSHMFGTGCRAPYCFDQVLFVMPFLSALGYTLGVLLERNDVFKFSRPG